MSQTQHLAQKVVLSSEESWLEQLLFNLLSYSIILVPIALMVIATRQKLLSGTLVHWFVYGNLTKDAPPEIEDTKSLFVDESKPARPHRPQADLSNNEGRSETVHLLLCFVGILVCYLIWGLLQEKIMTTKYENDLTFKDSQFLVFMNRIVAFVTGVVALVYTRHREAQSYKQLNRKCPSSKPSAPSYKFIYSSLSNVLSSWCQYEALKYVNFPTQCLSKSCKVIPVMLMSKVLMKKRYSYLDYGCGFMLALGMFVFMLNQPFHHDDKDQHSRGLLLSGFAILTLYLTFDAFTSNWQQILYSAYDVSNWQMMAAMNFYSILLTLTALHHLGNLRPALHLLASSPMLIRDCLFMSIMSSAGQMFVYHTIKRFGSVRFAVMMTLRQLVSILLSCLTYGHELNAASILGLLIVFAVAGFQIWLKRGSRKKESHSTRANSFQVNAQN